MGDVWLATQMPPFLGRFFLLTRYQEQWKPA